MALVNSSATANGLRTMFPHLPYRVLHCPVELPPSENETSCRAAKRAELNVEGEQAVILQVSRMEPGKGHHLHLQALATLLDRNDWVCWMVGGAQQPAEQKYLEELRAHAQKLGLGSRVRFLGQRQDVADLMRSADIFCQPNAAPESFGIVFIEALGAGLPVVSFALGGAAEIIDETCGLLAAPKDIGGLSHHLRKLLAAPALRRTLGERGPARARQLADPAQQLRSLNLVLQEARYIERGAARR
jgi:glycosyltransferase involved in cell wall biosynthesis